MEFVERNNSYMAQKEHPTLFQMSQQPKKLHCPTDTAPVWPL